MIRIGINGYGNLGRGVEKAIAKNPDMELVAVFSRRGDGIQKTDTGVTLVNINEAASYQDKIDVMILCGGSATDLPIQGPKMARLFNTVDSFDTHAKIPNILIELILKAKKQINYHLFHADGIQDYFH